MDAGTNDPPGPARPTAAPNRADLYHEPCAWAKGCPILQGGSRVSLINTLRISASALTAQRLRMDTIASNLANTETTRTPTGGPYRRQRVVFAPILAEQLRRGDGGEAAASPGQGVQVTAIQSDAEAVRSVYDPTHPDADEQGNVLYPDIDVVTEMTDMLLAARSYEANVTAMNATKAMALKALDIGRG
jgi:flagellar basal-body rod protein FlgC